MENLTLFIIINIINGAGYTLIYPLLPILGKKENLSESTLGWMIGIFPISSCIMTTMIPILGKKFSRIKLLSYATFFASISTFLYSVLIFISNKTLLIVFFFALRIFHGLCATIVCVLISSLNISSSKKENTQSNLGKSEIALSIGTSISPLICSIFYKIGGYTLPFLFTGAFSILAFCLSFQINDKKIRKESDEVEDDNNYNYLKYLTYPEIYSILLGFVFCMISVTFSYPLRPSSNVLNDLSFEIKPGKTLAICGFSGSGKTTISNLLERFYDVNKGNIYIDDVDIKDYNIEYLRKNIGFVEQEPVLNSGSILSNIVYGIDDYKEEELKEVLKITCVDKFINDNILFPKGLDTLVGEMGIRVSGGQKQRIAIARALMKNSKIIIFDEATSALDAESEAEVQKSIYNLIKKRGITLIIIAHRLSTIVNADKIIVINKGKIVESGNHKELMNKNGQYKKLFEKQIIK